MVFRYKWAFVGDVSKSTSSASDARATSGHGDRTLTSQHFRPPLVRIDQLMTEKVSLKYLPCWLFQINREKVRFLSVFHKKTSNNSLLSDLDPDFYLDPGPSRNQTNPALFSKIHENTARCKNHQVNHK